MDLLCDFLRARLNGVKRLAVLGVGSTLRADDGAGMLIAQRLQEAYAGEKSGNVQFYAGETAPENFSGKIKAFCPSHLLIIDAADLGQAPGTVAQIDPEDVGGPAFCSHMLPLKVMIRYLEEETGAFIILLGIQYKSLDFDAAVTKEVSETVDSLCAALKTVIDEFLSVDADKV